jgi:hypothetical protein
MRNVRQPQSYLIKSLREYPVYWTAYALGVGAFLLFLPVCWFEFTLYDDAGYVFANPYVVTGLSSENLDWAFTTLHGGVSYWHPLTWISHQIDAQVFGANPGAHHLTNVVLHITGGVLLFRFLQVATKEIVLSASVSAMFLIHPLHVESVAWVAERKDVLAGVFWMGTLCAYRTSNCRPIFSRLLFGGVRTDV